MKYFMLLLLVFSISGCVEKIIYKPKPYYKSIPTELITDDINITKPIDRDIYINSNYYKRELLLRNMIIDLYGDVYKYKNKLHKIKKYDENASKLYNSD